MTITVPDWVLIALIVVLAVSAVTSGLDAWLKWRQIRMAKQLVPGQIVTTSPATEPVKRMSMADLRAADLVKQRSAVNIRDVATAPHGVGGTYIPVPPPEDRYPGDDYGDKV